MSLILDLLDREKVLLSERVMIDDMIAKINRYVTPYDYDPHVKEYYPGGEKGQDILDGTAQDGLATAVNTIISSVIPSDLRNFSIVPDNDILMSNSAVNAWYASSSQHIFRKLSTSNLRTVSHPVLRDVYAKGTGCVFMTKSLDKRRFVFRPYPIGSFVIAEDEEGAVDTVMRRSRLSVRVLSSIAPRLGAGAGLSDIVRRLESQGKLDDPVELLHCVYPRPEVDKSQVTRSTPVRAYPFASVWIERENQHVIYEGGYLTNPYKVPRWTQYPGFPYGFGQIINVLADIRTLNKTKELTLRSVAKAIDPAVLVQQNEPMLSRGRRLRVAPGAMIAMRDINAMRAFESGDKIDVAAITIQELQNAINIGLGVDRMRIEAPSGDTQRSATEIAHRITTNNRQLGPGLSKIEDEYLEPIVLTALVMEAEDGNLEDPPPEIFEDNRGSFVALAVRFEGTLARSARQIDLTAITNFYTVLNMISPYSPEVKDLIRHDDVARLGAQAVGFSDNLLYTPDEVEATRAQRQKEQQEAALQQGLLQMGQMVNDIPPERLPQASNGTQAAAA